MSSGREGVAMTRARKRKVGERDSLWDVVVNNDDICFKHILPRLNLNDEKFSYEGNTETRALIKRSSRAGDLKKKFNCLLYTSPSPRDGLLSRMPSSA